MRAAGLVGAAMLLSRVVGLVREMVTRSLLGVTTVEATAFVSLPGTSPPCQVDGLSQFPGATVVKVRWAARVTENKKKHKKKSPEIVFRPPLWGSDVFIGWKFRP